MLEQNQTCSDIYQQWSDINMIHTVPIYCPVHYVRSNWLNSKYSKMANVQTDIWCLAEHVSSLWVGGAVVLHLKHNDVIEC